MNTPSRTSKLGIVFALILIVVGIGGLVYVFSASPQLPPEMMTVPYASTQPAAFDHEPFNRVCQQFVDEVGFVDYAALQENPADLDSYLDQVSRISPHSNLAAFATEAEALAYWINAYNAWMMKAVIDAYPVDSVKNISKDPTVFGAKTRTCGGKDISLDALENDIVRNEFVDPRFHFALNCAAVGCPWLPRAAFTPDKLDEQLDREMERFFHDPDHLRVDPEAKTVLLSQYFNWYGEDFVRWMKEKQDMPDATVLDYVKMYAPQDMVGGIGDGFTVRFIEYDWRLNDQNAEWGRIRHEVMDQMLATGLRQRFALQTGANPDG